MKIIIVIIGKIITLYNNINNTNDMYNIYNNCNI